MGKDISLLWPPQWVPLHYFVDGKAIASAGIYLPEPDEPGYNSEWLSFQICGLHLFLMHLLQ